MLLATIWHHCHVSSHPLHITHDTNVAPFVLFVAIVVPHDRITASRLDINRVLVVMYASKRCIFQKVFIFLHASPLRIRPLSHCGHVSQREASFTTFGMIRKVIHDGHIARTIEATASVIIEREGMSLPAFLTMASVFFQTTGVIVRTIKGISSVAHHLQSTSINP